MLDIIFMCYYVRRTNIQEAKRKILNVNFYTKKEIKSSFLDILEHFVQKY